MSDESSATRVFRVVPPDAALRGAWSEGPLVHGASFEEIRQEYPEGSIVELLSPLQMERSRLREQMRKRCLRDEDAANERAASARARFVKALTR